MFKEFIIFISGTTISGTTIDKTGFWTFSLVIVTFLLVAATVFLWRVGRKQLGGINKTSKAEFIKKFSKELLNENTRDIIMLFDYNALNFRVGEVKYGEDIPKKEFPYFLVNEEIVKQLKIDSEILNKILNKKIYSSYEIDDYILGVLEDMGSFVKEGLIDIGDVYDYFDWYIEKFWNNGEIHKYIEQQRTKETDGEDIYANFEYLFNKCSSFLESRK